MMRPPFLCPALAVRIQLLQDRSANASILEQRGTGKPVPRCAHVSRVRLEESQASEVLEYQISQGVGDSGKQVGWLSGVPY